MALTPIAAFPELQDLVHMQISFAAFKEDPSLIWKRADPIWFERLPMLTVNSWKANCCVPIRLQSLSTRLLE